MKEETKHHKYKEVQKIEFINHCQHIHSCEGVNNGCWWKYTTAKMNQSANNFTKLTIATWAWAWHKEKKDGRYC